VNLVTTEFPVVLADALERVLGHAIEVLAPPDARSDNDQGMIAAQAG
jgi:hypothetical protein